MAIGIIDTGISIIGGGLGLIGGGGRKQKQRVRDQLRDELMNKGMKFLDVDSDDIDSLQMLKSFVDRNQAVAIRTINNFFPNGGKIPPSNSIMFNRLRQSLNEALAGAVATPNTDGIGRDRGIFSTGGLQGVTSAVNTVSAIMPLVLIASAAFVIFNLVKQ